MAGEAFYPHQENQISSEHRTKWGWMEAIVDEWGSRTAITFNYCDTGEWMWSYLIGEGGTRTEDAGHANACGLKGTQEGRAEDIRMG